MTRSRLRATAVRTLLPLALLAAGLRLWLRQGHVPGLLPRVWGWSYYLPIPMALRQAAKRLVSYSFIVGAVAIIPSPDGQRYLLARHHYPLNRRHEVWGLPGGTVEKYEQIDEALRRELRQEAGVEIEVGRLVTVDTSAPPLLDFVYACTIVAGTPAPSSEVAQWAYVDLDHLPPDLAPRHRRLLHQFAVDAGHLSSAPRAALNAASVSASPTRSGSSPGPATGAAPTLLQPREVGHDLRTPAIERTSDRV